MLAISSWSRRLWDWIQWRKMWKSETFTDCLLLNRIVTMTKDRVSRTRPTEKRRRRKVGKIPLKDNVYTNCYKRWMGRWGGRCVVFCCFLGRSWIITMSSFPAKCTISMSVNLWSQDHLYCFSTLSLKNSTKIALFYLITIIYHEWKQCIRVYSWSLQMQIQM